jgi:hypothetical protein
MTLSPEERDYAKMIYEDNAENARRADDLRGSATSLLVTLIGALLAATAFGDSTRITRELLALFVCAFSLLGAALSWKLYEKSELYDNVCEKFRRQLERDLPDLELKDLLSKTVEEHKAEWKFSFHLSLRVMWPSVFALTFVVGAALLAFSYPH